uniref:FACT complex subunit SSRP1 n=1 Tax=Esox lucius TaxID=8010 RepID=A0A6Q2XBQ7_ESOLU
MGDALEFSDIYQEVKGSWNDGRLRFSKQHVVFKNIKTGKVDSIPAAELSQARWRRVCLGQGVKLTTSTGHSYRYDGFREGDFEKIAEFFRAHYKVELLEKDLCVKGWNWGAANFSGPLLSFEVGDTPAFEIPLASVSQCATGKNEVTLEFHQNDEAEVSLMEVRFYVPPRDATATDEEPEPVEVFRDNVLSKADVIQATGDALCVFRELQCLTPRGRYDIRIYPSFLHLHGKTFDYKIPYTTVLRLFLLPHKDQRQIFFVVSLDPPIKQGQTRYHFLILIFSKEEVLSLSLNMTEEEVEKRYEGKLSKNMSGPLYEMVSRVMKALVNRKITVPGNFLGHSGTQCITCSFKASSGLLYPLERAFIYVHKPPVHLRFEEVSCVNFARGTTTTRSFDFEIKTKQGNQFTFSSIEREEYGKLFDFVTAKKLSIKNRGFKEVNVSRDSDEDRHDAYLERMKAEGKIREEANDSDDYEGESGEYDSKASASDSSVEGGVSDRETKKRAARKAKVLKERKPREKKQKDGNAPKRPMSAYFLWLNASREAIKSERPGMSVTEVSRRAGEMWRELGKEQKEEWDVKAEEAKKAYEVAMREYRESGKGTSAPSKGERKKKGWTRDEKKRRTSGEGKEGERERTTGNDSFKSREFVSSDESSSDRGEAKRKRKVRTHAQTHTHRHTHTDTHTQTHTHAQTHAHTHRHTDTHTQVCTATLMGTRK